MTTNAQELFEEAPSLDDAEADVESTWAAEIDRRAVEARQNLTTTKTGEQLSTRSSGDVLLR